MKTIIIILCYLCYVLTETDVAYKKGSSTDNLIKVLNYEKDLTLQCDKIQSSDSVKWLKNNEVMTPKDGHIRIKTTDDLSLLTIHWATDSDVAQYSCHVVDEMGAVTIKHFTVIAKPHVRLPHKKTVIENETLQLECDVMGTPPIIVTWTVGNKTYNESEDRILLTGSKKGITNNFLILRTANLSDRGYITCAAYNAATEYEDPNSVRVFIRVIDTNTPVRIFVWMCIGVLMTLIMVFTYEKWRRAPESDCNESHQTNDQKA